MAEDPRVRTQTAIAAALRTMQALVSGWLSGRNCPGALMRAAIEILTDGYVPADSWRTAADRKRLKAVQPMRMAGT